MDLRDSMTLSGSGSGSYYIQRLQPDLQAPPGIQPLSNPNVQFQPNIGSGSTLPLESPLQSSVGISPHGVNVGAPLPSGAPQGEIVKRKRGRPRKYGPDGAVSLALSPSSSSHPGTVSPNLIHQKRGRGRPPGSGKKQQLATLGALVSGSAGMGFSTHVINVAIGEDVATKIMAFAQQGQRAICILSATGAVSTATLHQPSTSGGSVTYEGRFEIVCLSGSFVLADAGNSRNRTGGISVSLASPDGQVIGGGLGGLLIAASPVQVIIGSFIWGGTRTKVKKHKKTETNGGATDSDHQPIPNRVASNETLTPTSTMGDWPASRPLDNLHNSHVDIDLMRG